MRPKKPIDLSLAPVAAEIDRNLQPLRAKASEDEIVTELRFAFPLPLPLDENASREERMNRVEKLALQGVELHGWEAKISKDGSRISLSGGSVSLDLGLSAAILRYIEAGSA